MSKNRLIAYGMLLAVSIIWGIAAPVIKFTLDSFPPLIFLTYRFFLTSLILLPVFALTNHGTILAPFTRRKTWMLILVGLLGSSINLGFLFWGLNYTSSIAGSLLSATSPVFVVLAGAFFLKEIVSNQEKLGLLIAFLGSIVITLSPAITEKSGNILGNLLIMIANFTWVAYVILAKRQLQNKVSPLFLTTTSFFIGFVTLLPITLVGIGSIADLVSFVADKPITSHLGVWYMALVSGALAYWLYQEGQRRIEASEATIFSYLSPIFAAPLALFWLGETITTPFLFGAIIIAGGVVIAEYKKRKSKP